MLFGWFAARRLAAALLAAVLSASPILAGPMAAATTLEPVAPGSHEIPCVAEQEPNDLPEEAPIVAGEACLTGTLPELRGQDLVFWDVPPAESLVTWRITITGIPTTITSVWVYDVSSEDGVYPPDTTELFRVDSDATSDTPGVREGIALAPGRYLLGIARGDPADGSPPPPDSYQVRIEHEQALPPDGDVEPNDDAVSATPVDTTFALTGAAWPDPDAYRWTLSQADAAGRWQIDLLGTERDQVELALQAADGTVLATTRTGTGGSGSLYDLQLPSGAYTLVLASTSGRPAGYVLSAAATEAAGWDPEPDDAPDQALPIAIGQALSGRLARPRDIDQYRFSVPPELAGHQLDVGITVTTEAERQVCVVRVTDGVTRCRAGRGDIVVSNELLAPGDHRVVVDGTEDLQGGYTLSVADAGPVVADREVEPNDSAEIASPFDPAIAIRGRSANGDLDWYRITITGEPQVWRLDATGTAIRSLQWLQPDRTLRGTADIAADGARASLWDMALVPGDHWIAIETRGDAYQLTLTPLGPRAEGAEREPNNDRGSAEPIALGQVRTGRLPGPADTDVYRFSLGAAERITLRLVPPDDAAVRIGISTGTEHLARVREPAAGIPFLHRMALPAGDYELTLQSDSGSTQPYTLDILRDDPFAPVADLEPNDVQAQARPVPATLHVAGRGFGVSGEDDDWYVLPPLAADAAVAIHGTGGVVLQELRQPETSVRSERNQAGDTWTTDVLPAGTVLLLNVSAPGDYTLDVASAGLPRRPFAAPLPVTATLALDATEVAAYTEFGQRVTGMLHLVSTADTDLALAVDALATQPGWTIEPAQARLTVPAGATLDVPVTVVVASDAWADVPVRLSVGLRDDADRSLTASADVTPRRDAPLVAPEPWWPVPATMLGGLDVASRALGGTVVDSPDSRDQAMLHDGFAMTGIGFSGYLRGVPLTFTVDLATDAAVPVAGIILNPLSQVPALGSAPRHVELLLSQDGGAWESVLDVELSTLLADQAFALPTPVPARFAQLRLHSAYGGTTSYVNLGEWQVIASPDWQPPAAFNLADPALGGHIAWMTPGPTDPSQPDGMLTDTVEPQAWTPWVTGQAPIRWAIGFQDDRTALITDLEWVDGPASDPAMRFEQVQVAISTDNAVGPWQELGTWSLTRAADGSVAPFRLAAPTWARFVRLSGNGPESTGYWQLPTTIRVHEQPVEGAYRSVLGAWGRSETAAIRELLEPADPSALELVFDLADGNDTPDTATPLVVDVPADARIRRGQDIDWYTLTVPATDNVVDLRLATRPDAGLVVTMQDAVGASVELEEVLSATPDELAFRAEVEPGAAYRVRVEQAPLSTVFTYDTSGSMGAYLSYVTAALRGFAADVLPGEEAVLVMPFGDRPLVDHWSDDAYEVETAVAGAFGGSGTSAAETSIAAAAKELGGRPGARAILVITDAETSSYASGWDLWDLMDEVRPIVFTVHVAGGGYPALTADLMQDWAAAWGGRYEYASSHAQIDRAFDRLATWLRRPAAYAIRFGSAFVSRAPGSLTLEAPPSSGGPALVAGSGVAVEILLDTSGSMLARTQGGRRIDVAKDVLRRLVTRTLSPGLPTALRIFKAGKRSCDSQLIAPLGPLDPAAVSTLVDRLKIDKGTKTPLAATLQQVAGDLSAAEGLRIIVLITDGQESCKGDPEAAIRDIVAQGLDVRVNIVGFDIDDAGLREQIARWAALGNGQAFDANGADQLEASIAAALAAPFRVLDADGVVVATGVIGGDPVPLPPGTYRVEVLSNPPVVLDPVEIPAETAVRLRVEPPASPAP